MPLKLLRVMRRKDFEKVFKTNLNIGNSQIIRR
jgi:hypothetical protein